ncbi:unnamed protein product [Adineta ricciae]|uniref:Palmitoyltransferase n=1 Tax=Adineta ricciae TaxID=249248 RepID=A0A814FW55_ADIRI|nr:unnamed protein product [Adineta ricciae]CAF0989241.1 unnamed protein product [Adineta ricciae]
MVSRKLKFLIPRDRGELVPIFLTLFLISVYVIFELSVILPTVYHNIFTYKEILHLLFGFYAIFNVMGNLYLSMIIDTSVDTIICPVMLPAATIQATTADNKSQDLIYYHCNWHYCHQCEVNVPPRSKHCFLCKRCILKHEHHCSFIGRCIGLRNIRYYVCFLVWTWIGLFYCNILHMDYTYELVGTFSWRVIIGCLFPLGAWLFSLLDHFSLLLSFLCSTSIMLSLYISTLIVQQFFLIVKSQTWHEYQHNIHLYDTGRSLPTNLEVVLGKRWQLVLFSPLISSSPIGDGMTFDMRTMETNDSQRIGTKRI